MKDRETVRMEINIGGERITLTVPFNHQDAVRDTEALVGQLYDAWTRQHPGKKPREILAMVAYQFAAHYSDLLAQQRRALAEADRIDDRLSALLRDSEGISSGEPVADSAVGDLLSDLSIGL